MDQLETAARNYKNALKTGNANAARKKYKSALVHAELSGLSPKRVTALKSELKKFKGIRSGLVYTLGAHAGDKAARMAARPPAPAPAPAPRTNVGPGAARRFLTGFLNRGASHQALAQYAKMAARATKASPKSEKNFLQIFEAGAGLNKSGAPLGRRIGAPARRLIENVVFPQLEGPAPPLPIAIDSSVSIVCSPFLTSILRACVSTNNHTSESAKTAKETKLKNNKE